MPLKKNILNKVFSDVERTDKNNFIGGNISSIEVSGKGETPIENIGSPCPFKEIPLSATQICIFDDLPSSIELPLTLLEPPKF